MNTYTRRYGITMVGALMLLAVSLYAVSSMSPLGRLEYTPKSHSKRYVSETIDIFSLNLVVAIPILVVSMLLYLEKRNPALVFVVLVTFLVSQCASGLMSEVLKVLFGELRPDYYARDSLFKRYGKRYKGVFLGGKKSFPSGHTTNAFSGLILTLYSTRAVVYPGLNKAWKKMLAVALFTFLCFFSIMIGIERVMHNKHFVHDVMSGAVVGVLTGISFYYVAASALKNQAASYL